VEECVVADIVEATGYIRIQDIDGLESDRIKDGRNGIMAGASGPEAIAVGLKFRLPFWFQGQFDERLSCSVSDHWNA
jgi:hypothetical protein